MIRIPTPYAWGSIAAAFVLALSVSGGIVSASSSSTAPTISSPNITGGGGGGCSTITTQGYTASLGQNVFYGWALMGQSVPEGDECWDEGYQVTVNSNHSTAYVHNEQLSSGYVSSGAEGYFGNFDINNSQCGWNNGWQLAFAGWHFDQLPLTYDGSWNVPMGSCDVVYDQIAFISDSGGNPNYGTVSEKTYVVIQP